MLKLIMVLLWMILLEVLLCAEAEKVTRVRGQLGSDVTLTCSTVSSDRHWYMAIHSQLRACIGRSFSSADNVFCSPDFKTKFSILENRLMVKNLTAEDCRLYYCGSEREGSIQFVETFRLVSNVTLSTKNLQNISTTNQLFIIIIIIIFTSASLALILLIMGGLFIPMCLRRKRGSKQLDDPSEGIYENAELL